MISLTALAQEQPERLLVPIVWGPEGSIATTRAKKKSEGPTLLVLHVRSPLEVPCHKTRADPLYLRLNPL